MFAVLNILCQTGAPSPMPKTAQKQKLTTSLEDYLESVLLLVRQGHVARVRDIAKRLGVSMPSVTAALKALSKRELVNYDPYQVVTLTDRGAELGEEIHKRHRVLRGFLTDVLALKDKSAEEYACKMEHAVDAEFLERLGEFVAFVVEHPDNGQAWLAKFGEFRKAARRRGSGRKKAAASRKGVGGADQG
jgi:DtxR family Mn-dependent transcriptional regulator